MAHRVCGCHSNNLATSCHMFKAKLLPGSLVSTSSLYIIVMLHVLCRLLVLMCASSWPSGATLPEVELAGPRLVSTQSVAGSSHWFAGRAGWLILLAPFVLLRLHWVQTRCWQQQWGRPQQWATATVSGIGHLWLSELSGFQTTISMSRTCNGCGPPAHRLCWAHGTWVACMGYLLMGCSSSHSGSACMRFAGFVGL